MNAKHSAPLATALLLAACGTTPMSPHSNENSALNTLAVRSGNHHIAAHAGDREAKPSSWSESEWENSVQAISSAKNEGVRWIEVDLQLNRHPSAITSATPYGILYLHHNKECEVITSSGSPTGTKYDIGTADPGLVDRCAERLENVLNTFVYTGRWMFEMKADTGYTVSLPRALNHLLKKRGQRTTEVITSLNEDMLLTIRDEAAYDLVNLNLTRVYGATTQPTNADVDRNRGLGIRYMSANVNDWNKAVVDYAKERGQYTMGWHWILTSPSDANRRAVELDLDIMITDSIDDMQARGWY